MIDPASISPLAFISQHKIRNENGSPIEFSDHYFLIRPYNDMSERLVVAKCGQIGFSVLAINKALWLAKHKRANVIYTLPSKNVVKDFVSPKVDPIIQNNEVYRNSIGNTDSVALKSVGDRFVYFRGSWEQTAAISISAHVLIKDEVDRSNQMVLQTYNTRLDDAKRERPDLGMIWEFSNPSIPGYGVDETWQKSDQKHWFVKCPKCSYEWYLKWPDNINMETGEYVCAQCHAPMSDETRRVGRWVNKKESEVSGYWINQMMAPWIPAKKIIADSMGDQSVFYNFTLGMPYISQDETVDRKTVVRCIAPDVNPMTDVVMGVDNGIVKTVVIGNSFGIFRVYETESWEEIESDIQRYNAYCVIDANPYPTVPKKLAEKYRGRVFIHYFKQDQKDLNIIHWGEGENRGVVQSDRTKLIDMVVAEFKSQDILFNMTTSDLEQYIYDWGQLFRTIKTSSQGIARSVWETIEGRRDHYAFATLYWRVALEKTAIGGGVVRNDQPDKKFKKSIAVSPDKTVPALDLSKVARDTTKKRKNWRTK